MLYSVSQRLRDPNHRSSTRRKKDKEGTLINEFIAIPVTDPVHGEDGKGVHRGLEIKTAPERTTDKALQKNMFRAFDGTALTTIGEPPQSHITSSAPKLSTGMLLQEHITSFLQRPPMDLDEWSNVLFEESEKEKRGNEWKMKRSKPRRNRPQVANRAPEESSASGSGSEDDERVPVRTRTRIP